MCEGPGVLQPPHSAVAQCIQAAVKQLQEQLATLKRKQAAGSHKHEAVTDARDLASREWPPVTSGAVGLPMIRRMATMGGQRSASAAAGGQLDEEGSPPTRPHYLLNMREGQLGAATSQHLHQHQPRASRQDAGQGDEDAEAVVLLDDGSDEQLDSGSWSEVESDASGGHRTQQTAAPARHLQNVARTQQEAAAAGSCLGKREPAGSSRHSSRGGSGAENLPPGSHGGVLLAAAGPGRLAMHRAPGTSFIRDAAVASVGIDRGKYISSGPDGKGGVSTAYKNVGSVPTRVGWPGNPDGWKSSFNTPVPAFLCSLQMASGKKARVGGSGAAVPITSFFSRAQQ